MKNWIRNHKEILVFVIYASLTFSLLFFHENWRDEAQAWLIARDCSIPELIDAMKYEGHFLLWYLIFMPFAKSGFPYGTVNIISWLITCLSVWLILRKAPFSFDKRVLIIFTFPLLYLYPVISRCYCLIPLAIVLMSIFYKDRQEKPLRYFLSIVLLLNTHIIMAGMVVVVCIDYLIELYGRWDYLSDKEKKITIASILIAVFLMLVSVYPLLGCLSENKEIRQDNTLSLQSFKVFLYYPLQLIRELYIILGSNELLFKVILAITLIVTLFELKTSILACFKISLCIVWQCFIYAFIYGSSFQRTATVIFIILFFKWIDKYKLSNLKNSINDIYSRVKRICWVGLIMINILGGVLFIKSIEIPHNFSNAHEIANYVNDYLEENSIVLCGSHAEFNSSIIPYTRKSIKFYHVPGNRYYTYVLWDNINKINISLEDIKKMSSTFHDVGEKIYYVFCKGKGKYSDSRGEEVLINELIKEKVFIKIVSTNEESISAENYVLYKVNLNNISTDSNN